MHDGLDITYNQAQIVDWGYVIYKLLLRDVEDPCHGLQNIILFILYIYIELFQIGYGTIYMNFLFLLCDVDV